MKKNGYWLQTAGFDPNEDEAQEEDDNPVYEMFEDSPGLDSYFDKCISKQSPLSKP